MRVKKGDRVEVLAGKDVGKRGDITRVLPASDSVIVDGANRVKKHQKATRATMQGGIIDKEMPIHASNVGLVCASCDRPVRLGYRVTENGKVRICRSCGADV